MDEGDEDHVEAFVRLYGLPAPVAQWLRRAGRPVQAAVVEHGLPPGTRNAGAFVRALLRRVEWAFDPHNTDLELEAWLADVRLDTAARLALWGASAEERAIVMAHGTLVDALNPSAMVHSRLAAAVRLSRRA